MKLKVRSVSVVPSDDCEDPWNDCRDPWSDWSDCRDPCCSESGCDSDDAIFEYLARPIFCYLWIFGVAEYRKPGLVGILSKVYRYAVGLLIFSALVAGVVNLASEKPGINGGFLFRFVQVSFMSLSLGGWYWLRANQRPEWGDLFSRFRKINSEMVEKPSPCMRKYFIFFWIFAMTAISSSAISALLAMYEVINFPSDMNIFFLKELRPLSAIAFLLVSSSIYGFVGLISIHILLGIGILECLERTLIEPVSIRFTCRYYQAVIDYVDKLDVIWRNAMAFLYVQCIAGIACCAFFFAGESEEEHQLMHRIIFAIWGSLSVGMVMMPSVPGIALNKKLEDLSDKVYRVMDPYAGYLKKQDMQLLLGHMTTNRINMTVGDTFDLTRGSLLSIFSVIVTYFVLLVQFARSSDDSPTTGTTTSIGV